MAKVLLGRLFYQKKEVKKAIEAYAQIESSPIQLHPQVIIERDKALSELNEKGFKERKYWLDQVNALNDEWIAERKVQQG
ncbi:hypothetical protein ES705_16772 [subsurface metagenome]